MAGGASWELISKRDRLESWKKQRLDQYGAVEEVELWERKSVEIEIARRVRVDTVSLREGDLGDTSGSIQCFTGAGQFRTVHTRMSLSGKLFACTEDEIAQEQPFADWYIRRQVWVSMGEDELVGTETPTP